MAVAVPAFDLVDVKLAPPVVRAGTVLKSDTIESLCANRAPLVTIVAPAGYGKTTLLARWAEADPRPFAWVALDGATTTTPSCSCATSRAPSTASSRSRPRCSTRCPAPAASRRSTRVPRLGRALARSRRRWCWCSTTCTPSPIRPCLDVLAELFEYVPAGSQIAVASREEPALPLARWRAQGLGARDRRGRPPARRAGGRAAAGAAGVELDAERALRADRADGGVAGRAVPRGAVDAGRGAEPGERRGLHRRRPVRVRVLPLRAPVPAAGGRGAVPDVHVGAAIGMCGGLCDAVLETTRVGAHARDARAHERLRRAARPAAASGIATTTCSASCCATSSSGSEPDVVRDAQRVVRWPGASPTT